MDRIEHERGEVRGLALTKAFELLDGPAQRGIIRSEQCEQAPPRSTEADRLDQLAATCPQCAFRLQSHPEVHHRAEHVQ